MTTLLNTLFSEKGELFLIGHGRRVLLAHCRPQISIYEEATLVPVLGASEYRKKSMRFMIAMCGDTEFTGNAVEESMQKAERYELTADLMRNDGIVERFYFHNISLVEINPAGEWEFELNATEEQCRSCQKWRVYRNRHSESKENVT